MVARAGFEPAKAEPTDLQSVPFDHSGISPDDHYFKKHLCVQYNIVFLLGFQPKFSLKTTLCTRTLHQPQPRTPKPLCTYLFNWLFIASFKAMLRITKRANSKRFSTGFVASPFDNCTLKSIFIHYIIN